MKPILYNIEMVRAIQEDRKTVTRRVVKNRDIINGWDCEADGTPIAYIDQATGDSYPPTAPCPYKPGDILWVRETWRPTGIVAQPYAYRATEDDLHLIGEDGRPLTLKYRWHPSIHMPHEAARLFLRVTDMRVERLQNISVDGIEQEGITLTFPTKKLIESEHLKQFIQLWDTTIKPVDLSLYGWEANPWVWVIEFERISKEAAQREEGQDG